MTQKKRKRRTIAILTGGGDVPGLNPAIRAITVRALREGYRVLGVRHGWAGLVEEDPGRREPDPQHIVELSEEMVNKVGRTGGTFLHSSRTRPSHVARADVPPHCAGRFQEERNDLTPVVLENVEKLGIDVLVPIGGDDTLSYGVHLHQKGLKVIAIPKTMDNDVPGTDYCIGFSTCVTRTIEMTHALRTTAGSHERFLVIEVFGRYAGFTALLPTMAGAANRCVIPEHPFDVDRLCELLVADRSSNPSQYSVVLVSEGAKMSGMGEMSFEGIGDRRLRPPQARWHRRPGLGQAQGALAEVQQRPAHQRHQPAPRLPGAQRQPDALDSIVPMAFGNLALDLILEGVAGRLVNVRNGRYDNVPIDVVTSRKKVVDVAKYYVADRLRPRYENFENQPVFIMTSDY